MEKKKRAKFLTKSWVLLFTFSNTSLWFFFHFHRWINPFPDLFFISPSLLFFAWLFSPFCPLVVAQGRVRTRRQVNPSSDCHRFEGGTKVKNGASNSPSHHPQYINTNQNLQEQTPSESQNLHRIPPESSQTSLPSNSEPQDENQAYLSALGGHNEEIPHLHSDQAHSPTQSSLEVFGGSNLMDWLVERGLCAGRDEAKLYGGRLLQGGVFRHLTGLQGFRDEPSLLYHFTGRDRWSRTTWAGTRRSDKEDMKTQAPKQKCLMVQAVPVATSDRQDHFPQRSEFLRENSANLAAERY